MSDEQILAYCRETNRNASYADVEAMRSFMHTFDCEDALTPQDAHQRILASMELLITDVLEADSNEEKKAIMRSRLKGL